MSDTNLRALGSGIASTTPMTFTVEIRVRPDKVEDFERELLLCLAGVREESTCVSAYAHRSDSEPGTYLMYERWKDKETFFSEVRERPYFRRYRDATAEMLLSEKALHFWSAIEPIEEGVLP